MELQIALYKLQLLAQKWLIKSTSFLSWHSALQLASIEINNNKNQVSFILLYDLKTSNDDEHSDRLNHRYTVGFRIDIIYQVIILFRIVNSIEKNRILVIINGHH